MHLSVETPFSLNQKNWRETICGPFLSHFVVMASVSLQGELFTNSHTVASNSDRAKVPSLEHFHCIKLLHLAQRVQEVVNIFKEERYLHSQVSVALL